MDEDIDVSACLPAFNDDNLLHQQKSEVNSTLAPKTKNINGGLNGQENAGTELIDKNVINDVVNDMHFDHVKDRDDMSHIELDTEIGDVEDGLDDNYATEELRGELLEDQSSTKIENKIDDVNQCRTGVDHESGKIDSHSHTELDDDLHGKSEEDASASEHTCEGNGGNGLDGDTHGYANEAGIDINTCGPTRIAEADPDTSNDLQHEERTIPEAVADGNMQHEESFVSHGNDPDNIDDVQEGNSQDDCNNSESGPPYSSLTRVETNDNRPDEDEQTIALSNDNNLLPNECKLPEDLLAVHSPTSMLEDKAGMDTSLGNCDTTLSSNQSCGEIQKETLINDDGLQDDSEPAKNVVDKCQDISAVSGIVTEMNIPNDEKNGQSVQSSSSQNQVMNDNGNVESTSSQNQQMHSNKNEPVLDICNDVIEEIISTVLANNGKEESMEVDGQDVGSTKEFDKGINSSKKGEGSDCIIIIDEDIETVSGMSKQNTSQMASADSKSSPHKNSDDVNTSSTVKDTKENKQPTTKPDEDDDDDIMVIEETSSAPARKPNKALDNSAKRCKLCKKIFSSAEQLRKHVREAHGLIMIDKEQILRCRICSFRGIWSVFVKHLSEKHPSSSHLIKDVEKEKPCSVCAFRGQKNDLEKHMREKHPGFAHTRIKNTTPTGSKVDINSKKQDSDAKSHYSLRPRKPSQPPPAPIHIYAKESKYDASTSKSPISSTSLTSQKISWTPKQSSMLVDLNTTESNESISAEGVMKQKAFFEKLVVDGTKMGKKQIRLDVLLEKCDRTVFECGLCQQSFPNYLQVFFHQKLCLPTPEKSSRIIVYLPFETIMSQFVYKTVGLKKVLQCVHCTNRVSAQNVSAMIQALHLSVHVVPEVIIRTYYNGVVNNRIGHARQDSNKKAYSWDEVLKPVSVNRSSVVSSRNNNLDRYICTSGRLHQMESRHVLNDDIHEFGRIHSSSSDDESEQWETTFRRRKQGKKKKKTEFLSPNSKQKQSLLASVNYKLTSKKQHEREQRMAKRDEHKRKKDKKRDDSDSESEFRLPAKQKLSFSDPMIEKTQNYESNVKSQTKLRSLLTPNSPDASINMDESGEQLNEFGGLLTDDNYFPELDGFGDSDQDPQTLDESQPELPPKESPDEEVKEVPSEEPEEDLGPLLTEEDLAEYWRLFDDEATEDCKNSDELVPEFKQNELVKSEPSKSILSLLSSLPKENDILDYYGGSKQPLSSKSLIFMTTQQVFKYFALMPAGTSSANFACNLRGCTAIFSVTADMAAHLGSHFPMRVIIQDYPATSGGSHVVPLLTSKQVLQHYRARKATSDERFRYSCCYKRCNASSILDQSLSVHLMKHFKFICIGNILLRKAEFADHPLLSHYKCLRGARPEHSSIFQLTCKECEFFVTTYVFKGKLGDVVEAELSAHALSHDVGHAAEEALRKMCRSTSGKLQYQVARPPDNPTMRSTPKVGQKTALLSQPAKSQNSSEGKRTVSVTEPELLKKFGATVGGWKCLVKHCGFLHRGVKDLFIFANHLRRHILGCKKIIVMKKKTSSSSSTANRISQGNPAMNKPKPPIDVVTIDDPSDDEQNPSSVSTEKKDTTKEEPPKNTINKETDINISKDDKKKNKDTTKEEPPKNSLNKETDINISKDDKKKNKDNTKEEPPKNSLNKETDIDISKDNKKPMDVKVILNKLPLDTTIRNKIEAMNSFEKSIDDEHIENNSLKRKNDIDDEKSAKKSCKERDAKEASNGGAISSIEATEDSSINELSKGLKRKKEELCETEDAKILRISPVDKNGGLESQGEDVTSIDIQNKSDDCQEGSAETRQTDDGKDLTPAMEILLSELKSTIYDIALPITTVEKFFKQEIQSNLNRSSAVIGTMNFTCLMCKKTGFKGKDFELVRHLKSHIGKEISLKMRDLQVKDDDTSSPKSKTRSKLNSHSLVHHNLEDLRKLPEDRIQLRFEEVENFYVKNVRLSRSKSELTYGVIMYTCVECNVGDLKTEHLVKHLEDHVEKTIKLIRNPAKSNAPNFS